MKLRLITPVLKQDIYLKALRRTIIEYQLLSSEAKGLNRKTIKQQVLYGTKYINDFKYKDKKIKTREEIEDNFNLIQLIQLMMEKLTPNEFVNLFPIKKEYDGVKWCSKDYYTTIDMLAAYDMNKPLGDKLNDFLWDYQNDDVREFMVNVISTASDIRRLQGKVSILEQWAEDKGIETYTLNEADGYIMSNQTGETMPYKKPLPNYMQLVK